MTEAPCETCPSNPIHTIAPPNSRVCEFYENYESLWSPTLVPAGVYTIDEMKRFGATWKHPTNASQPAPFCPYFGSRRMLQIADVIVLNYQYVLDPKVSQVNHSNLGRMFKKECPLGSCWASYFAD